MTMSRTNLERFLHDRSPGITQGWYAGVKDSAVALGSPAEVRSYLSDIWDRMVAFLLLEDGLPRQAEPIGARFIFLRIRPHGVGEISRVLVAELLQDAPDTVASVLRSRLPNLLAGLMTGLVRSDREKLLEQQEEIRYAYARSLHQAEEQLRIKDAGIEASINAILMLDLQGRITYVNPAFLAMWGYQTEDQVLDRHVSGFGEWRGDIEATLEILSEQGGWVGELLAERADGSRFDVQVSVSLVRDRAGRPASLMVFFIDITERKKTQEMLRRRALQASFLNQIGEEIAAERTRQEVLDRAVHLARETFGFHQVAVLLLNGERDVLEVAAVVNPAADPMCDVCAIPLGEGITGWAAQQNETVLVDDVSVDARYIKLVRDPVTVRSELAVPIHSGARVIGVIDVQSPDYHAFGEAEQVVLETLADQIAVALENARLYQALQEELTERRKAEEALRKSVQRLKTVHQIDQAILGAKSQKEIAEALLHNVQLLVPCQRASIDLFDFEADELVIIAAIQTIGEGRAAAGTRYPLTLRALLFEMLGQHQVVYVKDLLQLPQSSPLIKTLCDEGLRSALVGPITAQDELIGILSLGSDQVDGFKPDHKPIIGELADTAGIAIQQARLFDSIRQHRERLRRTMGRLAEVEETERRRVVRELHDRVGQNLTALDLTLSLVRSQLEGHGLEGVSARLDDSLGLVEQTNRKIRQLMVDLRPPVLDDYGLLSALHWFADRFSARSGIPVTVHGREELVHDLSPHVENALFRITQEALTNIGKHAQADGVTITLSADGTGLRFVIRDNGLGFRREDLEKNRDTWGLLTMRERAESVGARCVLDSTPGQGTRVVVEVPNQAPPTP